MGMASPFSLLVEHERAGRQKATTPIVHLGGRRSENAQPVPIGVDANERGAEAHPSATPTLQLVHDILQILHRPGKAIDPIHDQRVACAQEVEQDPQFCARSAIASRFLFRPDRLAPRQALAWDAGSLRSITASAGLSLGDRFCLALCKRLGASAYTADKVWRDIAGEVGVKVVVIR